MKKIAFLILASAFFFSSCKTTNSSAENAAAQNLSEANEISEDEISDSQITESEIANAQIDENAENEDISELESAQNENQSQISDEIQGEQNSDEKNETNENAQIHDELDKMKESEINFAQENSADENSQKDNSSSNEVLSQENSSENESDEISAQDENARSKEISSEEKIPQAETDVVRGTQTEQTSSQGELGENENALTENVGAAANASSSRDPEIAELDAAQGISDSRNSSANQSETEARARATATQNPAGENSKSQNQNSRQRQNDATRQNQRQNVPADLTQNDSPKNSALSERNGARQNSPNENPSEISSTGNSARQDSKSENSSSTENKDEIASAYDFSDNAENFTEGEAEEKQKPLPSRTLTLKRNQFVDIIYPGNGWIYLGEEDGDHFTFYGRKQGRGESVFTLRSKKAGKAILHFYKNDALTGKYIDDYIELNVTQEAALDASHVIAPSYAQAVPQKYERKNQDEETDEIPAQSESGNPDSEGKANSYNEKNSAKTDASNSAEKNVAAQNAVDESVRNPAQEAAAAENVQTVIQTSRTQEESAPRTSIAGAEIPPTRNEDSKKDSQVASNAASLLERAQKAYDEKRFADAIDLVQKFLEIATENIDAGIFLKGQILEAQSEVRDIKGAINSYDTVVKNFPQSKFWTRANERGIYLKRFYINIR